MMNDGISVSSYDSEIKSKERKNCRATFKIQMKIYCLYLKKENDALFNNSSIKPAFVLSPLNAMLKKLKWTDNLSRKLSIKWIALIFLMIKKI